MHRQARTVNFAVDVRGERGFIEGPAVKSWSCIASEISSQRLQFGRSGVGAFGFGDRGVNSDELRRARRGRSGGRRREPRAGKEDEEKEERRRRLKRSSGGVVKYDGREGGKKGKGEVKR